MQEQEPRGSDGSSLTPPVDETVLRARPAPATGIALGSEWTSNPTKIVIEPSTVCLLYRLADRAPMGVLHVAPHTSALNAR